MSNDPGESNVNNPSESLLVVSDPVTVVEASTPMPLMSPNPTAKGPWIVYQGTATVRVITEKDWAAIGLKGNRCEWNYLNRMQLPESQFSEGQLNYLLNVDGRFKLSDKDITK